MKKLLLLLLLISTPVYADLSTPLNFREQDGSPDTYPYRVIVSNDTLTDNADGTITLETGSGSTLPVVDTTSIVEGSADATKELRFEVDGFTTGTVRVLTPPNADATIAGLGVAQNWTADQTYTLANLTLNDGLLAQFGTGLDAIIGYRTQQTPDSLVIGVGTDSNGLILCEKADMNFDFAHALQTNPTLFIHSAAQSTTQWISLTHDGTDGVIDVGTGVVSFPDSVTITGATLFMNGSSGLLLNTNNVLQFGNNAFVTTFPQWFWSTAQTPDTLLLGTGSTSNHFLIIEGADQGFDFAHAQTTNPTLFIHSAAQSTTQWLSLTHNGTNGFIDSGAGNITFDVSCQLSANASNFLFVDNTNVTFGTGSWSNLGFVTQQTPDTVVWGLADGLSNSLVFCERTDTAFDFAHANQTNPTIFIHSTNQSTTQWLSLTHNGTNGLINVGTGSTIISADNVAIGNGATTPTSKLVVSADLATTTDILSIVSRDSTTVFQVDRNKNVQFTNSLLGTTTGSIGWSVQNAANQACNTTCTVGGCVYGIDTAALGNILACTDATADSCLCAGS